MMLELTTSIILIGLFCWFLGCSVAQRHNDSNAMKYCNCPDYRTVSINAAGVHVCQTCIRPLREEALEDPETEPRKPGVSAQFSNKSIADGFAADKRAVTKRRNRACNTNNNVIKLDVPDA